jgi:hypothetical protein
MTGGGMFCARRVSRFGPQLFAHFDRIRGARVSTIALSTALAPSCAAFAREASIPSITALRLVLTHARPSRGRENRRDTQGA